VLAEGIEVKSAALQNGLLRIDLVHPQIQPGVRVVEIQNGGQ
jgi:HSP20 family molecular chaperone IbpA